jgi:GlcNAc-PI de-N-acetylase
MPARNACAVLLIASLLLARAQPPALRLHAQTPTADYAALVFYIGAHQDDWELFRGNAAMKDLADASTRVVFIYASAGDAGRTDGWWEARERGALAAVRSGIGQAPVTIDHVRVNDHVVLRYSCRNSASYVLRLPDGRYQFGKGYPATNNESLTQLRDDGKAISAVDKSATYRTWADFRQTLQSIMDLERTMVPSAVHPLVNAPDYFGVDNSHQDCQKPGTCNACDHPDHLAVADALRQFVAGVYNRAWWVGYDTQTRPENLAADEFMRKGRAFFAYSAAVLQETTASGKPVEANLGEWRAWGARDYYRTVSWDQKDEDTPACEVVRRLLPVAAAFRWP